MTLTAERARTLNKSIVADTMRDIEKVVKASARVGRTDITLWTRVDRLPLLAAKLNDRGFYCLDVGFYDGRGRKCVLIKW